MNYNKVFLSLLLLKYSTSVDLGNDLAQFSNLTQAVARTNSDILHYEAILGKC